MDYKSLLAREVTPGVTIEYRETGGAIKRGVVEAVEPYAANFKPALAFKIAGVMEPLVFYTDTLFNTWI